jgi:hypothetical protein
MTLTYQLDQIDYLQHQLFLASKSERIKKKRTISWIIVSISIFLVSLIFYRNNNSILFYCFLGFGIYTSIFYPLYQRQQYRNHYAKFIAENYKYRFGQIANINFSENAIETIDATGESKINLSEIENITETGEYFYPRLKSGGHLIIPKSKIIDVSQVRTSLINICEKLNINFIEDQNWKWK